MHIFLFKIADFQNVYKMEIMFWSGCQVHDTVLYCTVLYCTLLYCTVLTVLCFTYCTVRYLLYRALLTVLCFTYCTVLYLLYYLGGYGSSGSSQENISSKVYSSANYNTIMVEFENGNRYNSSSPVISSYFTKLHYMFNMFSVSVH